MTRILFGIGLVVGALSCGLLLADPPAASDATPPSEALVNPQPAFLANVSVDHADGKYFEKETISARFLAERDSHLYLLYHQMDDTSWLLFPNKARPDNRVKAKQEVTLPAAGEQFRFRVRAPFGEEALQVLASTEPIAELDALDKTSGKAAQVSTELIMKLRERIQKAPARFGEHRVRIQTFPATEQAEPARKPTRVGLFIAVDKYQDSKSCSEHEEVRRSAERMAKILQDRGGVASDNAKLLSGDQSTRAGIEEAITKWLPSKTQPGDTVFLFYCGHGNQLRSLDRRPDGRESYLTVHDNDLGNSATTIEELEALIRRRMIMESTLARWLQELPGRQIVLMFEACHSGGFATNKGKQVPGGDFKSFFTREAPRVKGISQLNTVLICACAADEVDRFTLGPDAVTWMPYFLTEAVEKLPAPVTVDQAFTFYVAGVRATLAQQSALGKQLPLMVDNALLPIELVPKATEPVK